ncbi:MAG: sugar-binding transcriptional regulator [Gammaproteobacteria bacterium]|nr:sugar-binding transcriptional regulator [Gammaproteobacteria bacterium]
MSTNNQPTFPEKDIQAIDAAKLYYQGGYSQQEVANTLGVSRPTVSKLLQYANEKKFVVVTINDPRENYSKLTEELKQRYKLSSVRICPTPIDNDKKKLLHAIGEEGAQLLESLVRDDDIIGVEWSRTTHSLAQALRPQLLKNIEVVQLRGSEIKSRQGLNEAEIINTIAQAFQGKGQLLPLPIVFDDLKTKNMIQREPTIWRVLENTIRARIAVFTVSAIDRNSVLYTSGFYSQDEMNSLKERSVGGICARFVDEKGRICLPDLNNRTVGISLPDLRNKEQRILVAGGSNKVRAMNVALTYGYANHLVTDVKTANLLTDL